MEDNKFKYQYSHALYLISEGCKNGKINEIEKMILKSLILTQYTKIDKIIKKFENSGDSEKVWEDLKHLADQTGIDSDEEEISDRSTSLSTNEECISSPKDSALYRKKRTARTQREVSVKEANCNSSSGGVNSDSSSPIIKMKYIGLTN